MAKRISNKIAAQMHLKYLKGASKASLMRAYNISRHSVEVAMHSHLVGVGVSFGHKTEPYIVVGRDCDNEYSIGAMPEYNTIGLHSEYTYKFPKIDNRDFKQRLKEAL